MRRTGPYLVLVVLLFSSCIFVKREFRRGYYLDLHRREYVLDSPKTKSLPERRKITTTIEGKQHEITPIDSCRAETDIQVFKQMQKQSPKEQTPRALLKSPEKALKEYETNSRRQNRTPDPFSLATVIAFTFLAFFIPPLTVYLVFGKGKLYKTDLWICLSGVFLFLLSRAFLLANIFTLPVAIMMILGYAAWIVAILFALFHLYRAFLKRPKEL